jgi:tripartite-type tricarboxylate transporter receptor subunit TctC
MNTLTRRSFTALTLSGLLAAVAMPLQAQAKYPDHPVSIVVPFAPGGSTDIIGRKLAQKLSEYYGQTFVIENKSGAGGNIGTSYAARSKPDGYTLLMGTVASHGVVPNLYKQIPYDPVADFKPIAMVSASPQIVVVHPDHEIKSVKDLVEYARKNQDKMTFASSGTGTTIHLAGEVFNLMAGTKMQHVPFQGSGPALNALLGRHVDVMFDDVPSSSSHVRSGSLRALAVTGPERNETFPDLPTLSEAGKDYGLEGFNVSAWFFLTGPENMPDAIADDLNVAVNKILADDDMKAFIRSIGGQALPGDRAYAEKFTQDEQKKWAEVIEKSGIEKL